MRNGRGLRVKDFKSSFSVTRKVIALHEEALHILPLPHGAFTGVDVDLLESEVAWVAARDLGEDVANVVIS